MKRKYALSLALLGLFSLKSNAQDSIIGEVNYGLLDKYIQAAKEYYPKRKVTEARMDMAKASINASTISYLDIFSASYFYRPNDNTAITPVGSTTTNPYIVNGIQYGVTINLGTFLQKPFLIKRAKAEYQIAKLESLDYDITLATEVKKRYYTYLQTLSELKVRTTKSQDNKTVAENSRRRFENGEITLDAYNSSRTQLADASTEKIQNELNFLIARDALEEMIGKKLTEIK